MNQKETNHRERVKRAAQDGGNRLIFDRVRYRDESPQAWITIKVLSIERDNIVEEVLKAIRENYTIRPRVRK